MVAASLAVHPDRAAAGQARLRVHPRRVQCAGTFADGASRTAEDKVGELLDEIERRARAEHVRQREEQRLDAVYRQQRSAAVVAARDRFSDDLRATAALEQVAAWETAQRLRSFATAMCGRDAGKEGWLKWIEDHANRLDPPGQVWGEPALPDSPEWADLAPYLKAWPAARPPWWTEPSDPASP